MFKAGKAAAGQSVVVCGWARTIRAQKAVAFIGLNDGSCGGALQLVVGYHQSPSRGAPEGRGVTLDVTLDVDPGAFMTEDDPVRAAALHWMLQRERPRGSEPGPRDHRARVPR